MERRSPSLQAFHEAVFEEKWPLFRLALLISAQDQGRGLLYDEWESIVDGLADIVRSETSSVRAPNRLLEELNEVLFEDFGLVGNLGDYYNPDNSYIDRVLEKKTGIPLTLSILYMAVAERAGIPVEGVGIPGHFMVKIQALGRDIFADPFNKGRLMTKADINDLVSTLAGRSVRLAPAAFRTVTREEIITRLLMNLRNIYLGADQIGLGLETTERLLLLEPNNPLHHRTRGLLFFQLGETYRALKDLTTYQSLSRKSDPERNVIEKIIRALREKVSSTSPE